jgi:hypothetical protein
VCAHLLQVWQRLGLPELLQLDNDSAFCGGERPPRRFGLIVRLCLYLGIEIVFIPPGEPKRNWLVENVNRLWSRAFWKRYHFRSFQAVLSRSPQFVEWYAQQYRPRSLNGRTPAQAQCGRPRQRLLCQLIHALPEPLPITAGRVHFIRRVTATVTIRLLDETWKISKSLAHQYVWATVVTHCQRLEVYHQRSAQAPRRLIKIFDYQITEPVRRLRSEFKRRPTS